MQHSLDIGKRRFRSLVSAATDTRPRLPLVHSSDVYVLDDVLANEKLEPQQCSVFSGEALIYLFYGRPAFRPNLDAEPVGLKHYFPVCFLFKPNWSATVRRAFPFDSGAFKSGFYDNYLHTKMKLGDFSLEADLASPGKIVSLFFGTNSAYLLGKPQEKVPIDPSEFEANSYAELIRAKDSNATDNRSSSIEIQTAESIPVVNAVSAVILPSTFLDGKIGHRLKTLGIDALAYRTFERSRPTEYTSKIVDLCLDYYVRLGLVSEGDL